ncbi:MAG: GNAT family N-acetyltransferase [Flavobacteriales bacterium]|nr:GNAT family N-acetyltransferase [Flavobacteriales bacterium]NNK80246.1 GNAT family N-acetyltransferase [Flavobacteriales bacterium]
MKTKEIKISAVQLADAQALALLSRFTWDETFGSLFESRRSVMNYLNRNFSIQNLISQIDDPEISFWFATLDGLPVGYAQLEMNAHSQFIPGESICRLRHIYILKDYQSTGIGTALWSAMLEQSKDMGYEKMWLSVLNTHSHAKGFYEKKGFTFIEGFDMRIGVQRFDMDVMVKEL